MCTLKSLSQEPDKLTSEIKGIIVSSYKDPDFHYMLTELAFLKVRSSRGNNTNYGIIPIDLKGGGIRYMFNVDRHPVFERSRLVLNYKSLTELGYQYKRLFDLLGLLYPDQRDLISSF